MMSVAHIRHRRSTRWLGTSTVTVRPITWRGVHMPIEPVVTKLRTKLAAISAGSKADFLTAFGPIHQRWHMAEMMRGAGTFTGKPIGFLSFHHEVLTVYQAHYAKTLTPGTMAHPSPPYRASIDRQSSIEFFAAAIEDWHNSVHRNTRKYGPDFADPMKNIYMRRFWQFHKFINNKFAAYLNAHHLTYDNIDHTTI
jgi:hypothetical protein